MNLVEGIIRGIQLSFGFYMLGSAASDLRVSAETLQAMVERGHFEIVGRKDTPGLQNQDGLRMAGHGAMAAARGYLGIKMVGDALR